MIKKGINFVLNLVMSVLVLGLICVLLISSTFFNKEYVKEKMRENRFYEKTYSDIKEDFENYTMQSGLELEILEGLFTKDKVEKDINSKIDAMYGGKKVKIETDSIRMELDSRIDLALEENNRVPSENEKKSIQKYEDVIVDCYQSGILYGRDFSISSKYLGLAKNICIIAMIVISILLLIINRSILKYISFIGVNLLFSGILCASVKFLLEKRIQHILILDAKFSKLLVNCLNDIIGKFHNFGIIAVLLGVILIGLGSLEKIIKTIENEIN